MSKLENCIMKSLLFIGLLLGCIVAFGFNEEEVELEAERCTLKGTLTTQDDPSQSTTLVILIAGSGPTDRNGNNAQMTNNSLKMLSDMLVENGYSCLRYDKRAIGESVLESVNPNGLTFDEFISDAVGWVEKYAADARFHSIVLGGHSQGSLVAMCAANRSENVAGVISFAGAGQPIHEVLKWQLGQTLTPELRGVVDAKLDTLAMGDTLKEVPGYLESLFHPSIQPFLISWMKYDPIKEVKDLKVPLLIINGTTDVQVTVSEAEKLKEARPDASYAIIKNMNHVLKFTKAKTGLLQLDVYGDPDIPLHKKLSKPVLKFLEEL